MTAEHQTSLRLPTLARPFILEKLFTQFGDVLIPLEAVRARYFRNLNEATFAEALGSGRVTLPVTTLDTSRKGTKFVEIHHLAAYIETRAFQADETLAARNAVPEN